MTVESNYAIAIARLSDCLKNLAPVFNQREAKPITSCMQDFSRVLSSLLGILIGVSCCLQLVQLVRVITLALVFQQSFENHCNE